MNKIRPYQPTDETELLALLEKEPDWRSFLQPDKVEIFKRALIESETLLAEDENHICGYLRAMIDGFGVYVSELYVAPAHRGNGFGAALLAQLKQQYPTQDLYVLSDEDQYYEQLGYTRVGSIYQL